MIVLAEMYIFICPMLPSISSLGRMIENVTIVLNESERDQLPQQCSVATDEKRHTQSKSSS